MDDVPSSERPRTEAGRDLRRLPLLLAVSSAVALALRLMVEGRTLRSVLLFIPLGLLFIALLLAQSAWANRRRKRAAAPGAIFVSVCNVPVGTLRAVAQWRGALAQARLLWLTGGWVGGGLTLTHEGLRWSPSRFNRRWRRVPELFLGWGDVADVSVTPIATMDAVLLEGRTRGGSQFALNARGRRALFDAVDEVALR